MEGLLITPAEVRWLLEQDWPMVVLDARAGPAAEALERVEGDLRVSPEGLDELAGRLNPKSWILVYAGPKEDRRALELAGRLRNQGFYRARGIQGGLDGCREGGLSILPVTARGAWESRPGV